MSAKIRATVIAVVIAAAGWLAWGWLAPSDEAEIRALLDRLADGASGEERASEIGRVARTAAVRGDLDPGITVDAGPPFQRLNGREAVIATAARVNKTLLSLEIRFSDVEITVDVDRQRAHATLTAEAYFMATPGARSFDARELEMAFRRFEGRWVVAEVLLIRAIKPLTTR